MKYNILCLGLCLGALAGCGGSGGSGGGDGGSGNTAPTPAAPSKLALQDLQIPRSLVTYNGDLYVLSNRGVAQSSGQVLRYRGPAFDGRPEVVPRADWSFPYAYGLDVNTAAVSVSGFNDVYVASRDGLYANTPMGYLPFGSAHYDSVLYHPQDRVYVARSLSSGAQGGIWVWRGGNFQSSPTAVSMKTGVDAAPLSRVTALALGAGQRIFATVDGPNGIGLLEIDPVTEQATVFATDAKFNQPSGLAHHALTGRFYVANAGGQQLLQVSADGKQVSVFKEGVADKLCQPSALAILGNDLFVANATNCSDSSLANAVIKMGLPTTP